jgi:hypothetical protein
MSAFLRMLLVATALLTSGVAQAVLATGEGACCPDEHASAPACPPGSACACCPVRGAAPATRVELAPTASVTIAVPVRTIEPSVATPAADIFHPPRA